MATPSPPRNRGPGRPRVGFPERLDQTIVVEVNGAEPVGNLAKGDPDVALSEPRQIFLGHVLKREVPPSAAIPLLAQGPFKEDAGAE